MLERRCVRDRRKSLQNKEALGQVESQVSIFHVKKECEFLQPLLAQMQVDTILLSVDVKVKFTPSTGKINLDMGCDI